MNTGSLDHDTNLSSFTTNGICVKGNDLEGLNSYNAIRYIL